MSRKFYRTTVIIYTDHDVEGFSLAELGQKAETGDAICDGQEAVEVEETDLPEGVASFFAQTEHQLKKV
jgi:hypothetical protein